jgi:hypothetical protein
MKVSWSTPAMTAVRSWGRGGVGRDGDCGIGVCNIGSIHVIITVGGRAGVGGLKKTWLALEGPALGCRLDTSSEVGTGDLDSCSMLRKYSGLAICSANCSDWAFCLSLAMGGPQLSMVDQGIREVLMQLAAQGSGDK